MYVVSLSVATYSGPSNGEVLEDVGSEKVKKTNVIQTLSFYLGQMEQPQRKVFRVESWNHTINLITMSQSMVS